MFGCMTTPRTDTLLAHGARIARAMALLARDPARTPRLEELAEAAAFSPYHFHRVYRLLAGETPAETLARLRMSRAAADLIKTPLPMERVARRAGFGSVAAFTRAFRAAYGLPPGAYRQAGGIALTHEEDTMLPVTISASPPLRLAAIAHRGAFDTIGATFDRLMAWAGARGLVGEDTRFLGIYRDDPTSVPEAALRSDAALTVGPGVEGGGEVRILEVPALRVAVLRHKGPYAELEGTYARLYGEWLPASGEEPADHPVMEDYLNDCRSLPPAEWLTDILLPLKPRG
jgi:AraC family transcriptional regulator